MLRLKTARTSRYQWPFFRKTLLPARKNAPVYLRKCVYSYQGQEPMAAILLLMTVISLSTNFIATKHSSIFSIKYSVLGRITKSLDGSGFTIIVLNNPIALRVTLISFFVSPKKVIHLLKLRVSGSDSILSSALPELKNLILFDCRNYWQLLKSFVK